MESSHVKELYNKELKSSLKGLLGSFVPLSVETNDKEFPSSGQSLRLGVNNIMLYKFVVLLGCLKGTEPFLLP